MQIRKLDKTRMRANNVRLIFEAIYRKHGITRAQLAIGTKMSAMNVGRIVDSLIDQGMVEEYGDTDSGAPGRPGKQLTLRSDNILSLGVALDVWGVRIGLVDPYGSIKSSVYHAFDAVACSPEQTVRQTAGHISAFVRDNGLEKKNIAVVIPGVIDHLTGHLKLSSQMGWRDLPIRAMLSEYTGFKNVLVDNDVKARALAESWCGAALSYSDSVLLTIGSGIGAGVVIGGSIYRGKDNMAGEIGHISINTNTKLCECGQIGCLQATITEPAILHEARTIRLSIDMNGITDAYANGEPWAQRLIDMVCGTIITTINLLANTYASEAIILCGSLIDNYPVFRRLINEMYASRQVSFLNTNFDLRYSHFGAEGTLLGAASVALRDRVRHLA